MLSLQKSLQLLVIISCLFAAGVTCTQAEEQKKSPATSSSDMNSMMNPMMSMMNPAMYMNMMNPMMGMMNPMMSSMMNPMTMMGPMMGMGGMSSMMNPMTMMGPMMGMGGMSSMMNPMGMMGGMGMPGTQSANPMGQMPGGQMMDPKQYEQWFSQWTEMMKNMTPQPQANQ